MCGESEFVPQSTTGCGESEWVLFLVFHNAPKLEKLIIPPRINCGLRSYTGSMTMVNTLFLK